MQVVFHMSGIADASPTRTAWFSLQSDYSALMLWLRSMDVLELAAEMRGSECRSHQQTSRFHGVRKNKRTDKFEAYIRVQGRHVHLGCHASEEVRRSLALSLVPCCGRGEDLSMLDTPCSPGLAVVQEAARCYDRAALHRHLHPWMHSHLSTATAPRSSDDDEEEEGGRGGARQARGRRPTALHLNFPASAYASEVAWLARTALDDVALAMRHEQGGGAGEAGEGVLAARVPNPRGPLPGWHMTTRRGGRGDEAGGSGGGSGGVVGVDAVLAGKAAALDGVVARHAREGGDLAAMLAALVAGKQAGQDKTGGERAWGCGCEWRAHM